VQQQRFFITRAELPLPADWAFESPYNDCKFQNEDVTEYMPPLSVPQTMLFATPNYYIPVDYYYSFKTGDLVGYSGAPIACVDCRLRGSITKPSFW
jgi:hypothetical protein